MFICQAKDQCQKTVKKGAWEILWVGVRVRETAAMGMIQLKKKIARVKLAGGRTEESSLHTVVELGGL